MNSNAENNTGKESAEQLDQLSMEELMETSLQTLREGEVVKGTVVAVTSDEVLVDIGFKCEGSVALAEFVDKETGDTLVEVNDEIEVYVERLDETEGALRLSRDRAAKLKIWKAIEESFRKEQPVTGRVVERVKGGLAVDIGIKAFLPGSLVDLRPNRRLEDYIGNEVEARIISFDRRRSNVVLSRKAILEQEQDKAKEETMAELEDGKVVRGTVKNITDYGVFVDLGGLDGLLHITDISWGRVGHPSEYFKVGDEVDVVILRFDREKERVSLGYKQRFEDPWILVPEKYPVGKRVTGSVVSIVDYGAFVVLEEGVEGLIHVSEMSWTKKVKNPRSILEVGKEVEVVVSEVDNEKRRLSLSLRATEPNPWEQVAETYHVGARIHGQVRNLTDFGAFVEVVPGVDGLVHISDMSWTRRINHPSEVVQKGEEVDAVITAIDVVNQRISLSMKELLPNEWEEYANAHGVGDVVSGTVTNITDFGVFVELAPGVEGLCHISEIDREDGAALAEVFEGGQDVLCRILRIDWNENRIGLSMHSVSQDDKAADTVAEGQGERPVETAMAAALRAGGLVTPQAEESDTEQEADVETEPGAEVEPEPEPEPEAKPKAKRKAKSRAKVETEKEAEEEQAAATEDAAQPKKKTKKTTKSKTKAEAKQEIAEEDATIEEATPESEPTKVEEEESPSVNDEEGEQDTATAESAEGDDEKLKHGEPSTESDEIQQKQEPPEKDE